jgi:hypothetical protein
MPIGAPRGSLTFLGWITIAVTGETRSPSLPDWSSGSRCADNELLLEALNGATGCWPRRGRLRSESSGGLRIGVCVEVVHNSSGKQRIGTFAVEENPQSNRPVAANECGTVSASE